jgi:hypothetical protein
MRRLVASALLCLLVITALGCAGTPPAVRWLADDQPHRRVYLVSHGWHTGLVLERRDLPAGTLPEAADFPGASYLEIGWGDRAYYPAKDPGLWLMLAATLWPTPGVLHVVGFDESVVKYFPKSEVLEIRLGASEFDRLARHIDASFERTDRARKLDGSGAIRRQPVLSVA